MKNDMKTWLSVASLLAFFCVGLIVSVYRAPSVETSLAANGRALRDPAAIQKVYDFSALKGDALTLASKQRLLAGFESFTQDGAIGISLGHFVVLGENGEKQFACRKYTKVILTFEGEGMAVGGEKPGMRIEGECREAEDINQIEPLVIPVSRILDQPVGDGEFEFLENYNVAVRFSSVADQWPQQWVLTSVKLTNETTDEVSIEREEIRGLTNRPVVLQFTRF